MIGQVYPQRILAFYQDVQPGLDRMLIDLAFTVGCIDTGVVIQIIHDITMDLKKRHVLTGIRRRCERIRRPYNRHPVDLSGLGDKDYTLTGCMVEGKHQDSGCYHRVCGPGKAGRNLRYYLPIRCRESYETEKGYYD